MSGRTVNLITTGLSLGLLHVLAGPDHLSALAALSVGSSWRAFTLGFRWGIGHSTGLVVVAIIFISLKGELDLRTMGRYCDSLVGLFMIALGSYGIFGSVKTYREKHNKRDRDLLMACTAGMTTTDTEIRLTPRGSPMTGGSGTSNGINKGIMMVETSTAPINGEVNGLHSTSTEKHYSAVNDVGDHKTFNTKGNTTSLNPLQDDEESALFSVDAKQSSLNDNKHNYSSIAQEPPEDGATALDDGHNHGDVAQNCSWCPFIDMHDPYTQRIVSFLIGLLHGIAGPGGILGVLPAVEMQNIQSSFLYLASFILASTLSMGAFAAIYGEVTKRIGATAESVELGLNLFSNIMSIVVGAVWFILSMLGKLEDFFH